MLCETSAAKSRTISVHRVLSPSKLTRTHSPIMKTHKASKILFAAIMAAGATSLVSAQVSGNLDTVSSVTSSVNKAAQASQAAQTAANASAAASQSANAAAAVASNAATQAAQVASTAARESANVAVGAANNAQGIAATTASNASNVAQSATVNAGAGLGTAAAVQSSQPDRNVKADASGNTVANGAAKIDGNTVGTSHGGNFAVSIGSAETVAAIRSTTASTRDQVVVKINATRDQVSATVVSARSAAVSARAQAKGEIMASVAKVKSSEAELNATVRDMQRAKSEEVAAIRGQLESDFQAYVEAAASLETSTATANQAGS